MGGRGRKSVALAAWIVLVAGATNPAAGAGKREQQPTVTAGEDMVWPLPPEKPRVRFVEMYSNNFEIESRKKLNMFDRMIGAADPNVVEPFGRATGVAADSQGRILIASPQKSRIWIIDKQQKTIQRITGDRGIEFRNPIGLAVDGQDNFYVSDSYRKLVLKFNKEGRAVASLTSELQRPTYLALDEIRRRLYVVDVLAHDVAVFNLDTLQLMARVGKRGVRKGEFNFPQGIAVDPNDGSIAVADLASCSVQVFDENFRFVRRIGGQGITPGTFTRPKGVAIDAEGYIWVVDAAFNNFQIFDKQGQVLMFIGGYGDRPGFFDLPNGIYIDRKQRVYVGDSLNGRVQVFQFLGGR